MGKKYKKQKEKLGRNAIIILVATVLVVVSVLVFTNLPTDKSRIDDTYSSITSSDHVFQSISYGSLVKKIESGEEVIVFIGKKDCQACQERIGEVNSKAKTLNVKKIYYLNDNTLTADQRKTLSSKYKVRKSFTPQLIKFNDGAYVLGSFQDMFGLNYQESEDTATNFTVAIVHVLNA